MSMGVLAPRLRTLGGSTRPPIDTTGNFPVHMSAQSPLNIYPNISIISSLYNKKERRAERENTVNKGHYDLNASQRVLHTLCNRPKVSSTQKLKTNIKEC